MTIKRISFQGEPGANSHIACEEVHPGWEPLPCPTFEDAFAAVEEGEASLAMIPIENSIAGRVADIHHLLPTSGLHIVGERFLRIQFALMAQPGADISALRTVHSHVHALGQCRGVIREESRQRYRQVIDRLIATGAEGIILGCTEIELLIGPPDSPVPVFPTTRLHVEAAVTSARDAVQVHGGYGYMEEFPVARFYRDAKVLEIGEGTSEVMRILIARSVGL